MEIAAVASLNVALRSVASRTRSISSDARSRARTAVPGEGMAIRACAGWCRVRTRPPRLTLAELATVKPGTGGLAGARVADGMSLGLRGDPAVTRGIVSALNRAFDDL